MELGIAGRTAGEARVWDTAVSKIILALQLSVGTG